MSASIMQAKGPGPIPANSTMRKPVSGPLARCAAVWVPKTEDVSVSVTSKIHILLIGGWLVGEIVEPGGEGGKRHFGEYS
jgi:hypothetical protein